MYSSFPESPASYATLILKVIQQKEISARSLRSFFSLFRFWISCYCILPSCATMVPYNRHGHSSWAACAVPFSAPTEAKGFSLTPKLKNLTLTMPKVIKPVRHSPTLNPVLVQDAFNHCIPLAPWKSVNQKKQNPNKQKHLNSIMEGPIMLTRSMWASPKVNYSDVQGHPKAVGVSQLCLLNFANFIIAYNSHSLQDPDTSLHSFTQHTCLSPMTQTSPQDKAYALLKTSYKYPSLLTEKSVDQVEQEGLNIFDHHSLWMKTSL